MPELTGIDHIYIAVSDMAASEAFYDKLMLTVLSCRKNTFTIGGDPHIQYFNRYFGYVLRPARSQAAHDPYSPALHHFCYAVHCDHFFAQAVGTLFAGLHLACL